MSVRIRLDYFVHALRLIFILIVLSCLWTPSDICVTLRCRPRSVTPWQRNHSSIIYLRSEDEIMFVSRHSVYVVTSPRRTSYPIAGAFALWRFIRGV